MSEKLVRLAQLQNKGDGKPPMSEQEQRALATLQAEARKQGVTLKSEGEGGLAPSLALGVFRRDGWRCKRCGGKDDLSLHHKGHLDHPNSKWLRAKAKSDDPNNIVTVCGTCHDGVHEEDRERGEEGAG